MKIPFKMNKENALILVLAGILCLVVVWPTQKNTESKWSYESTLLSEDGSRFNNVSDSATLLNYIENQEARLKKILEQIEGVGHVQVMIRASTSKAYVVEKDVDTNDSTILETDSDGGTRQSNEQARSEASIYTKDSYGNDVPMIVKELEPEIEGVLVAAQGGDQKSVVSEIMQAVQVLFDIPVHKIKVVKMKVD